MVYALYFFGQLYTIDTHSIPVANTEQVTIIICAKNEAENLRTNLPAIMAQRYSNASGISMYRVIVVNDASVDDTQMVLEGFKSLYPNLTVIQISDTELRTLPGKKFALGKAVAAAESEYLLLTDADCQPSGDTWLAQMVAPLHSGKQLVAGYGAYEYANSMLNAFIRWETLHSFIQYAGYGLAGIPYMAVGRNLACTKTAIHKAQQSVAWGQLPSGDDDLLVNAVADGSNIAIVATPAAITISPAKATWGAWLQQKQRHVSTGKYYKTGAKLFLGIYALSHSIIWVCFFILLFTPMWMTAGCIMLIRVVMNILLQKQVCKLTGERNEILKFVIADIGWMIYNFALSPYILLKNKTRWT